MFLGPILWSPINDEIWYERPEKPLPRVPVTGAVWNWFDADFEARP